MQRRKDEIQKKIQQRDALSAFSATYRALAQTLSNIYPDVTPLQTLETELSTTKDEQMETTAKAWFKDMQLYTDLVTYQDPGLFAYDKKIASIDKFQLPALWNSNKLSSNSKKYLWIYLSQLNEASQKLMSSLSTTEDNEEDAESKLDIDPPDISTLLGSGLPKEFLDFYKNVPEGMFSDVSKVAEKYSDKVRKGELKLEDLNFSEISKQMFQSVKMEDFQEMAAKAVGSMKGMADNPELKKLFEGFQR